MQILECEPGRIAYNAGLHKGCFYKGAIPTLQGQSDASDSVCFYYWWFKLEIGTFQKGGA